VAACPPLERNCDTIEQNRQDLLAALGELGRIRHEWRLGQTLANLAMTAGRMNPGAVWEMEDDEALAAARILFEQSSAVETVVA
jgi:hypothetical protein